MSDETFSFFDDPGDSPSPAPAPAPSAEPSGNPGSDATPQTVSVEQFQEVQKRLENAERWRQDVGRMFTGEQPQQQQADPQQLLEQLLTNPQAVLQNTAQQAAQQAQEAYRQEAIIQDRRSKNPHLAPIEHLIDWNSAMQTAGQAFVQTNHRQPSFAEVLDDAIALVNKQFQGVLPGAQTQNGGNRTVMNMDISGNGNAGNSRPVDLSTVSDADWPKYRDAFRRSQGL